MGKNQIKLGIVGVGKIVRDQHLPSIEKNGDFDVVATASRNASVDGVASYSTIHSMLESVPEMEAVALCMPPQYRFNAACLALDRGLHVLLEKPPGATVSEVEHLAELADKRGVSLYATWHSRHGVAVEEAKALLDQRRIESVDLQWKEDVRKWHPGQDWIWQAGGLGVFDPGVNGLSILTYLLPNAVYVTRSSLAFPNNKAAPIAAEIEFNTARGLRVTSTFDWREAGDEVWSIEFRTDQGLVTLTHGGGGLLLDQRVVEIPSPSPHHEYESLYAHFSQLVSGCASDVDLRPLKLVADAFLLADRQQVGAFND